MTGAKRITKALKSFEKIDADLTKGVEECSIEMVAIDAQLLDFQLLRREIGAVQDKAIAALTGIRKMLNGE